MEKLKPLLLSIAKKLNVETVGDFLRRALVLENWFAAKKKLKG